MRLCAAAAARVAGYTESCARGYTHRLLRRPDIQAAIAEWMQRPGRSARDLLRPEHRLFLDAYCVSWDAREAALAAGYATSVARDKAWRLLRRADIRAALIERKEKAARETPAGSGVVAGTLARAMRASLGDYMVTGADGEPRFDFARLAHEQMTSDLAVEIRQAGTGAGVAGPAGESATLRFKLHNRPAARERARDGGDARPQGAAALAQGLHPATGKPITNHDRAKALYHLIERAKQDPDGIEPKAAVDPAIGGSRTNRERAETVIALIRNAKQDREGIAGPDQRRPDLFDALLPARAGLR